MAAGREPLTRLGGVIAGRFDYFLSMTRTDAQKELERIEQELNAKAPLADGISVARVNRKQSMSIQI